MGMSHFLYAGLPQMEVTFIPVVVVVVVGGGGNPHMKGVGMVVGNFELNP